jgi:hypothetical protein
MDCAVKIVSLSCAVQCLTVHVYLHERARASTINSLKTSWKLPSGVWQAVSRLMSGKSQNEISGISLLRLR